MGFNMNNEVLASQWLTKEDVGNGMVVVIQGITEEAVGQDKERKFALHFRGGFPKPLLINKVNTRILVNLFGPDTDNWMGREIEVYNDPSVGFGGQITGGCRIRMASARVAPPAMTPDQLKAAYAAMMASTPSAAQEMAGQHEQQQNQVRHEEREPTMVRTGPGTFSPRDMADDVPF